MQRRRNIIRCDVCDDEDTTVAYPTTDLHLHRYNTQANEVAVGPLQARYDGIHRSHTTILGPNVRLGPKVQSPTDRYSLDKAVAAGTSHPRRGACMLNWRGQTDGAEIPPAGRSGSPGGRAGRSLPPSGSRASVRRRGYTSKCMTVTRLTASRGGGMVMSTGGKDRPGEGGMVKWPLPR